MISPRSVQQVKDAMRIEDVLGEFLDLKRKGPRYLGLCPFHNEKTPSFNVSPQLGIFKCFGCGESGDAITFLQKQEHLSFAESIRWLAKRYQIELEEEEQTPEQQLEQSERESLGVIQQWALNWSVDQMWNTEEGQHIGLSYFRERGFRDDIIKQFQLGYVPEGGDVFAKAALAHGFDPELLDKAGWIKRREDGTPWDFFQGRVTFPIHGLTGQPIAFGARTLKSDKKLPKYFNSPESALYVKSRSLYGISFAKKAIVEQSTCCLVEGYTDVISLHQSGIHNVVASSGTSLTVDQVRLIKRYAPSVTILYDGDSAGIKASLRGIDLILAEGLSVKVVLFPDGDDPDSFARTRSSSEIQQFIATNAKDFILFKAKVLMDEAGNDPILKAKLIPDLIESLVLLPDAVVRGSYITPCAQVLSISEDAFLRAVNQAVHKINRQRARKREAEVLEESQVDESSEVAGESPQRYTPDHIEFEHIGTKPQERDLLRMLLNYGHLRIIVPMQNEDGSASDEEITVAELLFQSLAVDEMCFDEPVFQAIYLDYRHTSNLGEPIEGSRYANHADTSWRDLSIDLLTEKHQLSPNWRDRHKIQVSRDSDKLLDAIEEGVDILKERRVDRMIREKQEELKTADEMNTIIALQEIVRLNEVKKALSKRTGRVVVG